MGKFERKYGKYAIKNLSLILVVCYGVGYLFSNIPALSSIFGYLTLNPYAICHGQVWRLVTWIIVPPSSFSLFTLITLFFYYSIGHSLENVWGDFYYNVYIFSGFLFTIVGSFLLYLFYTLFPGEVGGILGIEYTMALTSLYFSTYYINMSIFLAFAFTFPEAQVLLMFLIPVKVKWLGYLYAGMLVYEFLLENAIVKVVIGASLLNFIVFFLLTRRRQLGSPKVRFEQARRRAAYNEEVRRETRAASVSKHKCAICGRTDAEYPELQFRFCSKCNGNYEYCSDHLFTHKHVE